MNYSITYNLHLYFYELSLDELLELLLDLLLLDNIIELDELEPELFVDLLLCEALDLLDGEL
jgi:hypothetical protein